MPSGTARIGPIAHTAIVPQSPLASWAQEETRLLVNARGPLTFNTGTPVYAGLDLSARTDLTAVVLVGKVQNCGRYGPISGRRKWARPNVRDATARPMI